MILQLQEYGEEAEARFQTAASPEDFTDIAAELLAGWNLPGGLSLDTLFELSTGGLTGDAGRPGLIPLFSGPNVRMVAHLWADAADRLHQHDWYGAFQVIEGRSFNARYSFREDQVLDEFAFGHLARTSFDIFEPGHIQPVSAGAGLIHSVVYPGKPGLAVSLRVAADRGEGAVEYLRPGLRCPSHRRRASSAAQVDLLAQARQLSDEDYDRRFAAMVAQLDAAELLRLLDTMAFDGLEVPDAAIDALIDAVPGGLKTLASLSDIDRSDKTRELLGEQADPVVRDVICALFHSDGRAELADALRIAGYDSPLIAAGRGLTAILVDEDEGESAPHAVTLALGEAALTGDLETSLQTLREKEKGADHVDAHCEFVEMAFSAMEETPYFRCLFRV